MLSINSQELFKKGSSKQKITQHTKTHSGKISNDTASILNVTLRAFQGLNIAENQHPLD